MSGLWQVSGLRLRELLAALTTGGLRDGTVTALGLGMEGFESDAEALKLLLGLAAPAAATVVRVALDERERRVPPRLDLVWTGPDAVASTARATSQVVEELLGRARQDVIVAGYAFYGASKIFEPLAQAMRDHPALTVNFFVHFRDEDGHQMTPEAFWKHTWPWQDVTPRLYVDPRVAASSKVAMHAKCIVVDARHCLVGSANFTPAAHDRNVELGVLIEDPVFATQLAAQWRGLVSSGGFVAVER